MNHVAAGNDFAIILQRLFLINRAVHVAVVAHLDRCIASIWTSTLTLFISDCICRAPLLCHACRDGLLFSDIFVARDTIFAGLPGCRAGLESAAFLEQMQFWPFSEWIFVLIGGVARVVARLLPGAWLLAPERALQLVQGLPHKYTVSQTSVCASQSKLAFTLLLTAKLKALLPLDCAVKDWSSLFMYIGFWCSCS